MPRLLFSLIPFLLTASSAAAFQPTNAAVVHRATIQSAAAFPVSPLAAHPLAFSRTNKKTEVAMYSTTADEDANETSAYDGSAGKFDAGAVLKYCAAIGVQLCFVSGVFAGLDKLVSTYSLKVPFAANFVLFYFLALKSRVFNPLTNARPKKDTLETKDVFKRKMPSWTPPGLVFPIVWLLIIGPIRCATSAMVYQKVGSYCCLPILSLMLHLSIGDVWNTINNVERRYGVAVTGVLCVWLSKAHAAYQYSQVYPLAGKILGATLIWLTIASALVTATWKLNPDPATNKPEPLYPVTGKAETKFAWFSGSK